MKKILKYIIRKYIKNNIRKLEKIFYINSLYNNSQLTLKEKTNIVTNAFFPKLFNIQFNKKDFIGLNEYTYFTFNEVFNTNMYYFENNKKNPFIIDCGTNIGISVLYFKKIFPESKIICFEPDDKNFEILNQNIISQNWEKNVNVIKKGVSNRNAIVNFTNEGHAGSKIIITDDTELNNFSKIEIIDLIEFINNQNEQIDFLKLDIEGSEFEIVPRLNEVNSKIDRLYIEFHCVDNDYSKFFNYLLCYFSENYVYSVNVNFSKIEKPYINLLDSKCEKNTYYNFYAVNKRIVI